MSYIRLHRAQLVWLVLPYGVSCCSDQGYKVGLLTAMTDKPGGRDLSFSRDSSCMSCGTDEWIVPTACLCGLWKAIHYDDIHPFPNKSLTRRKSSAQSTIPTVYQLSQHQNSVRTFYRPAFRSRTRNMDAVYRHTIAVQHEQRIFKTSNVYLERTMDVQNIIIINFYSPVSNTRCHSIGHKMRIARIKIRVDSPGRWERA